VAGEVFKSKRAFQDQVERWHDVSEYAYYQARRL